MKEFKTSLLKTWIHSIWDKAQESILDIYTHLIYFTQPPCEEDTLEETETQ